MAGSLFIFGAMIFKRQDALDHQASMAYGLDTYTYYWPNGNAILYAKLSDLDDKDRKEFEDFMREREVDILYIPGVDDGFSPWHWREFENWRFRDDSNT